MAGPTIETMILADGKIGVIRFSNPPVNALGRKTVEGLHRAVRQLKQHTPRLAAIVIMPGSPETLPFSAGADIKEFDSSEPVTAKRYG